MTAFVDLTGQRFTRLVVLERAENARDGKVRWRCRCDCGKETVAPTASLRNGHTKSCGCLGGVFVDLAGQYFGRLYVLRRGENSKNGKPRWVCLCECGKETAVLGTHLRSGNTKSCGCWKAERTSQSKRTHGMTGTPEHACWKSINRRCYSRNYHKFPSYGGRGITVCERWLESFENFLADMGPKPSPKHSIDRIDNNGNYCPENCRWATPTEQVRNRRKTIKLTASGLTLTVAEWSERTGIPYVTIYNRLRLGWTPSDALSKPVQKQRRDVG